MNSRHDAKGSLDEEHFDAKIRVSRPGSAMYGVTNARINLKRWSLRRTAGSSQNRKVPNEGALRLDKTAPKSPGQVVIDTTFLQYGYPVCLTYLT
jgi:hypothetical protein